MGQKVKWLGSNLKDDATHRLVTDTQIEKWDKVDSLEADEWIELTPTNIGQYTCTKEDEYWTDMGVADGTIFDSTSLDEGNYIIKLGLDKLVPNTNTVSSPSFRYGDMTVEDVIKAMHMPDNALSDPWNKLFIDAAMQDTKKIYNAIYLNYLIETQTFIFLCQFFEVELSIDNLLAKLKDYGIICNLITSQNLNEEKREILFPECIKIKIVKEQFGPNNTNYVYKKYTYADIIDVDYNSCHNYKWDDENSGWAPCEFEGVPHIMKYKTNQAHNQYTYNMDSQVPREYITPKYYIHNSYGMDYKTKPMIIPMNETEFRTFNNDDNIITITPNRGIIFSDNRYKDLFPVNTTYDSDMQLINMYDHKPLEINSSYIIYKDVQQYYSGTVLNNENEIMVTRSVLRATELQISAFIYDKTTGKQIDYQDIRFNINNGIYVYQEFKNHPYWKMTNNLRNKYSISIKVNEETTYKYNNEKDVEIDLSSILSKDSNVVTDWNTAITNGEYYSLENSTNAPSTKELMGTVVRGKKSIVQTVYIDGEDEANSFHQFIRKGIISVGEDDTEVVTWKEWNELEYCIGSGTSANN